MEEADRVGGALNFRLPTAAENQARRNDRVNAKRAADEDLQDENAPKWHEHSPAAHRSESTTLNCMTVFLTGTDEDITKENPFHI